MKKIIYTLIDLAILLKIEYRISNTSSNCTLDIRDRWRPGGNPLDLNNLPEEYTKQALEESSTTTAASAEKTGDQEKLVKEEEDWGKDDAAKVYECRFCSLKFCKSQALGDRTLNRARQLVFSNEGLAAGGGHMSLRDVNIGGSQTISPGLSSIEAPIRRYRHTHHLCNPISILPPIHTP
uniref:Uncharacterized protein n=1 Tax=Ananas comosus var. bracteatus TaxID=296719 RepID=A0A6V7QI01_ANACO|nr:unnamed protein product [Ananas comosus var. bracteatus]